MVRGEMPDQGQGGTGADDTASAPPAPVPAGPHKSRRRRRAGGLFGLVLFVFLVGIVTLGTVLASGVSLRLPVWLVAEVEDRLNRAIDPALPDQSVSVGGIGFALDRGWTPVLQLQDIRLMQHGGTVLLTLPETSIGFDGAALLRRELHPRHLHVSGAALSVRRDKDGRFDLTLGQMSGGPKIDSLAALFDAIDAVFAKPVLSGLQSVEADGLSLRLEDARAGRVWTVNDGRLRLTNRPEEIAAEFAMTLDAGGQGAKPAQAVLVVVSDKATSLARITATVDAVPARDLAVQAAPLAPLGALDAPISGRLALSVSPDGIEALDGRLELGSGALSPRPGVQPIVFDRAGMEIGFDPAKGRIILSSVSVESPTLRLKASGQAYMLAPDGSFLTGSVGTRLPAAFLTQIRIAEAKVDPEGLFESPVSFSNGALEFRLRLNPFAVDVGQLALMDGAHGLHASGTILATAEGWNLSLDAVIDQMEHDRLLALWPLRLVPKTREWLVANVLDGTMNNVRAAVRLVPGSPARLTLGYDFNHADVRFIRTLPPIRNGTGYATVEGKSYTMVLGSGHVTAPQGGDIDMAGSVFKVLDFTQKPAPAEVQLKTVSGLTAALSLLDEPPFQFLTKANRPVDLGQGEARLEARLSFPLKPKIMPQDVDYIVTGKVTDFASEKIVKDKIVSVPDVSLYADSAGLRLSGPGTLGAVPFDVVFFQPFGKEAGPATVDGTVPLSPATIKEFGIALPDGMVSGEGRATVQITLPKGQPGQLSLTSDLNRIGLMIPGTGWSKPAAALGKLSVAATLSSPPQVDRLDISAQGMSAQGSVSVAKGGGLDAARFTRVALGDWFRGAVTISGRGKGRSVGIAIPDGEMDLRFLPDNRSSGGEQGSESPITVNLSRLTITEGIALTALQGQFSTLGGLNGSFAAAVNGTAPVIGTVVPTRFGTAARIQSEDAGAVLAAAGIFSSARGGKMDMTLTPRQRPNVYDGMVTMQAVRVVDAPVLAELLNAVSVVGILEQLNGEGLLFANIEGAFRVTPGAVEVKRGRATGASLGVTMEGVYGTVAQSLAMQGVISPVYLVNGIGAAISRKGEGVFGFNYELGGTADNPSVSVNPLSILTPGKLRDIFRKSAPQLGEEQE